MGEISGHAGGTICDFRCRKRGKDRQQEQSCPHAVIFDQLGGVIFKNAGEERYLKPKFFVSANPSLT